MLDRERVHGRAEYEFPQLELVRKDLEGLPELRLPDGYTLRHFRPGDESAWGEIMTRAFSPFWNEDRFRRLFLPHFGFAPERVVFVCHQDRPVGSASAFQWPGLGRTRGYLHMVGVLEEHCGQGLGYWLTVACLSRFREAGFTSAMLQTESFRLPAIKHYLRLGFEPALVTEGQREVWRGVLARLEGKELFPPALLDHLPVMKPRAFWWRTLLISQYTSWLNFKGDLWGRD
jgi:mycothiol synthase